MSARRVGCDDRSTVPLPEAARSGPATYASIPCSFQGLGQSVVLRRVPVAGDAKAGRLLEEGALRYLIGVAGLSMCGDCKRFMSAGFGVRRGRVDARYLMVQPVAG